MKSQDLPTFNGVYRTPGRAVDEERIPPPSLRTLLAPLARAASYVAIAAGIVSVFACLAPPIFGTSTSGDLRFIPAVDTIENIVALLLPASLVLLVALIARRVRPSWRGLRSRTRVLYVTALLALQSAIVVAGEAAIFFSRGGLHLFEPTHLSSRWLPDGRTAHLYTRPGFSCGYDVFVSAPLSFTAQHAFQISRASCLEPQPHIRSNPDGTLDLVDDGDQPLESQPSPSFSFGGGC